MPAVPEEKGEVTMVRQLAFGLASFAVTSMVIFVSAAQGSAFFA